MTTVTIGPYRFDDISYDVDGDVLYLSIGKPRAAADSDETPEGHVVRLDEHGHVIGVTIINARWLLQRDGVVDITLPTTLHASSTELASVLAAA